MHKYVHMLIQEYMERHTQSWLHTDTQYPCMCTETYRHRCKHMHTNIHMHTGTHWPQIHKYTCRFAWCMATHRHGLHPCVPVLIWAHSCRCSLRLPMDSSAACRPYCLAGPLPPPIHLCGLWPAGWTRARKWGLGKWKHPMEMAPGWGESG